MSTWVFDVEVYPNCTLFLAKCIETNERQSIWHSESGSATRLRVFVGDKDKTFVGFNSYHYDSVIVSAWCKGLDTETIKRISDAIIIEGISSFQIKTEYKLNDVLNDHIDLIEVAPSFVGLKAYGARMNMPMLQDLPYDPNADLDNDQQNILESYCLNDIATTTELFKRLEPELELRLQMSKQYGIDLRSKSDSQMAEQAFKKTLKLKSYEVPIPNSITYDPPEYLKMDFAGTQSVLEDIAEMKFYVDKKSGHIKMPDSLDKLEVYTRTGSYKLGIGGLHSTHDKRVTHLARDELIYEIDAASFYPTIILNGNLSPSHIGDRFINEYRRIYDERIQAKSRGDKVTADTLKISLNGTFGKLASPHSILYAPDLMLAVTMTGQFTLLMLIEMLEREGVTVLSANTDGIVIRVADYNEQSARWCVQQFEELSGFTFEFTQYEKIAFKDVNNYIAVKKDKTVKAKGIYAPVSLRKNPTAPVCAYAVGQWLARGTSFERTIEKALFDMFITARNVAGGGVQGGKYLGKVVRWYQSNKTTEPILYAKNNNKVPKSDGAQSCMHVVPGDWSEKPDDLDTQWYINECIDIAHNIGAEHFLDVTEIFMANFGVRNG